MKLRSLFSDQTTTRQLAFMGFKTNRALGPSIKPEGPSSWLLSFAILIKDAAKPLESIHDRNPILFSESSMTEWLDLDNLEGTENTTQHHLNELANESDEIACQAEFLPCRAFWSFN